MTTLAFPLKTWQEHVNQLFEQGLSALPEAQDEWTPATAIHENDQQLVLELDVPGVEQNEFEVRVEQGQLTVRGERKPSAGLETFRRAELRYGAFLRVFSLPDYVNVEAVTAKLKNGVLTITLPKREESKPRVIQVRVGAGTNS